MSSPADDASTGNLEEVTLLGIGAMKWEVVNNPPAIGLLAGLDALVAMFATSAPSLDELGTYEPAHPPNYAPAYLPTYLSMHPPP